MPELPEVETIRRDLEKAIVGRKILGITTDAEKLFSPSFKAVSAGVNGQKIIAIGRRAKLLHLSLGNHLYLLIHLKMTGRLLLRKKGDPRDEFQHVVFILGGGEELRFADMRLFGYLKLVGEEEFKKILGEYGPEPLLDMNLADFRGILQGRSKPVKLLLLDQELISGIGNIYANEALFVAGIDPRRKADSLSEKETSRLFSAIEKVLSEGLHYRGTTASDDKYVDAYGKKGHYQDHLRVYGHGGLPCPKCRGKIQRVTLGGRGTFFCPACQK
ncbi:MAG: bifunctional DNA-formamidopyrimidine glycosylase/DNA-(apurinic or apyrimidinic site) lyase [bacterium]|nr:bifunctional DNA-formamidopyrimidine glycosylase/DNA-(apurinic or apyrimidinic site) lyase [bacterium]